MDKLFSIWNNQINAPCPEGAYAYRQAGTNHENNVFPSPLEAVSQYEKIHPLERGRDGRVEKI
jgi:hypothetical protein